MSGSIAFEFKQLINIDVNLTSQKRIITPAIPFSQEKLTGSIGAVAGDRDIYFMHLLKKDTLVSPDILPYMAEVTPGRIRTMDAIVAGDTINYFGGNLEDLVCINKKGHFVYLDKPDTGVVIQYFWKELANDTIWYSSFPNLDTNVISHVRLTGTPDNKYIFISFLYHNGDLGLLKCEIVSGGDDIIVINKVIPKFTGYSANTYWALQKIFYYNGYLYGFGAINADTYTNEDNRRYFFKFDANTLDYLGYLNFNSSFNINTFNKTVINNIHLYKGKMYMFGQFPGEEIKLWRFDLQSGQPEIGLQVNTKYGTGGIFGIFGISQ